jgi:hypothetical protein
MALHPYSPINALFDEVDKPEYRRQRAEAELNARKSKIIYK